MVTNANSTNTNLLIKEDNEKNVKISTCYGCGEILRSVSILICAECLSTECTNFADLVDKK